MRIRDRSLSRQAIVESVTDFEIIESYPDDKYLPSYLVCSRYMGTVFHVLFAADVDSENVRVITAYHPDPSLWGVDLKTRRKP